jgi:ComF family protein
MNIGRIVFLLREYFFPSGCALCGRLLAGADECWYGLCGDCMGILKKNDSGRDRCDRCGRPLVSERDRCMQCRNGSPAFDRIVTLYPYRGIYRKLLGAYKFGKNLPLGHFLAERTGEILAQIPDLPPGKTAGRDPAGGVAPTAPDTGPAAPALVPVPPRPGKLRKIGWDQVEYLARLLEKEKGAFPPVRRCLGRLPAGIQKKLNREQRRQNLRGKIVLRAAAPETAILLDDVVTTGSTMDACATALRAGGARRVLGLCLFYS